MSESVNMDSGNVSGVPMVVTSVTSKDFPPTPRIEISDIASAVDKMNIYEIMGVHNTFGCKNMPEISGKTMLLSKDHGTLGISIRFPMEVVVFGADLTINHYYHKSPLKITSVLEMYGKIPSESNNYADRPSILIMYNYGTLRVLCVTSTTRNAVNLDNIFIDGVILSNSWGSYNCMGASLPHPWSARIIRNDLLVIGKMARAMQVADKNRSKWKYGGSYNGSYSGHYSGKTYNHNGSHNISHNISNGSNDSPNNSSSGGSGGKGDG